MASKAAVSVSKRAVKVLLAALCLITAQAVLASCEPEHTPMAARAAPAPLSR